MKLILRQLAWCSLAAAIVPLTAFVFSGGRLDARRLAFMFATSLIFALSIGIPLEFMLHRLVPKIRSRSNWIQLPAYAVTLAGFAVFGTLLGGAVICGLGIVPWRGYRDLVATAVQMSMLLTALFGVGGLASGQLEHRLNETNEKLRQKEADEQRARQMATEARLMSLESRVHPHFLFNAINSILALIRDDPRRAEDLLERMAALLRFSLDATQGRLVPLERELTIVRDYLEIERARFGQRLRFAVETVAGVEADVPPLSIQTLVENSVKFAVSPRREGGRVDVRVMPEGAGVAIEVTDDGPGFGEADCAKGHGLDLLRERLQGVGSLELDRTAGAMTVRMRVPAAVAAQ